MLQPIKEFLAGMSRDWTFSPVHSFSVIFQKSSLGKLQRKAKRSLRERLVRGCVRAGPALTVLEPEVRQVCEEAESQNSAAEMLRGLQCKLKTVRGRN